MPRRQSKPVQSSDLPEHLITQPSQLDWCLQQISASEAIAFDTEFVGEDAYRPELCLIQVATTEHLFAIDPFSTGSLEAFWKLLLDPSRAIVLHAGREDIRMCVFQTGHPPANVFDVQLAAGLVGLTYPIGYAGLVYDILGERMTKGETLTDWRRRPLLPAQVRYAFDDVRYLLPVWKKLTERLKRLKRLAWAEEEFAALIRKSVGDDDSVIERWRKVKGIGGLDRRGLAIVRALYNWRDRFAERINRPARHLLRDDVIAELSRRGPSKHEELSAFRGLPRVELAPILEAIHQAKSLPLNQCPEPESRENDPPPIVLLGNLLGVVLADWCARNSLAASLVATGSELKAIVRSHLAHQPSPDIPLCRGWRGTAIYPELKNILEGTTAIRVSEPGKASPLELFRRTESANDDVRE
jgi:ribonuclease D